MGLLEGKITITGYTEEDMKKAYKWLVQIKELFDGAEEEAEKYTTKWTKRGNTSALQTVDEDSVSSAGGGGSMVKLVRSIRPITSKRRTKLSLHKRIAWALYGKDDFEYLLEKVLELVTNLTELFPQIQQRLVELSIEEVGNIPQESIPDLAKVIGKDDEILAKAIGARIQQYDLKFEDVTLDGSRFARFGNEYGYGSCEQPATLAVKGMRISNSEYVHAGHVFHGPGTAGPAVRPAQAGNARVAETRRLRCHEEG